MEGETVLTQYLITHWKLEYRNETKKRSRFEHCNRSKTTHHERAVDDLPAHPAHPLHCVHHQLLQALLLRGRGHRQLDCSPCPYHAVYQCVRSATSYGLREDDRCVAHLCADDSLLRGSPPHLHRCHAGRRGS